MGGREVENEEIWRIRRNGLGDHYGGREVENSKKYGEIGEMGWPTWGGSGNGEIEEIWKNRRNGWSTMGGREVDNSKKFVEIGEMGWSTTMKLGKWRIRRNLEKSEKWAGRPWGSGSGEFEEI